MDSQAVAARFAASLVRRLVEREVDIDPLLIGNALPLDFCQQVENGHIQHINEHQYSEIFRACINTMGKELFKLESCAVPIESFRMMSYCLIGCQTLGQALERANHFYQLFFNDQTASTSTDKDFIEVGFRQRKDHEREHILSAAVVCQLAAWHRFFSWLIDKPIALRMVHVRANPACGRKQKRHQAQFGCHLRYRQQRDALLFPRYYLDYPIVQTERTLSEFLAGAPAYLLNAKPDTNASSLASRVRVALSGPNTVDPSDCDEISRSMNISTTTLRRKLKAEGSSFQQLKDESRLNLAKAYLRNEKKAIHDIAEDLGYTHSSTFYRSFKRLTNMTPGQYRRAARSNQNNKNTPKTITNN